jgi:hypothetical protein
VDQKGLAKNFKNTEKIATHGVFHREASNRFLKSASVSYSNEASRISLLIGRLPFSLAPQLGNVIANLELMPLRMNQGRASKIGQRQLDLWERLLDSGLMP